ncbi:MAG: hypothetical protein ACRDWF_01970 [Acidimicrobiia bacterium]
MPVAIRMDQTTDQGLGMTSNDLVLPPFELDVTVVFAAGAMLREEAEPVFPVGVDLDASLLRDEPHLLGAACHDY